MNTPSFRSGDRVAYSAAFCRSIGAQTGAIPALRGRVVEVTRLGDNQLVSVKWTGCPKVTKVIAQNLAHVGPNARFCAC